jgi:D-arabinose 1-dehydrogenase-like Zn-dependent alcohol dehydrogenase
MKSVKARAVFGPTEHFKATTIDRRDLGPKDVLIEIKYAGICHSDIHTARQEWRPIEYPLVPGHEIAGVVAEVGLGGDKACRWGPSGCRLPCRLMQNMSKLQKGSRAILLKRQCRHI